MQTDITLLEIGLNTYSRSYHKDLGIVRGDADKYIETTKKEIYKAIGMNKPTQAFNNAWSALNRNEFIGYDKESKKWIWL